ncbi:uncharacterized protein LOC135838248 [Planococcus citri]|uniref:uncharacterized protein LOC135838248 n=1 Tax=Planococcus citri TaxID=170843 RepID=UPI0031F7FB4D
MDPDAGKPFLIFLLGVHLTVAFKNVLTDVFNLINHPEIADILGADEMLVAYIIIAFEFVQLVIFLVAIICVKKIQGKPSSSLLNTCMICILLDTLLMIVMIYRLIFGEAPNQVQSLLRSKDLDADDKEVAEKMLKDMNKLSRWCFMKMLFDLFSGLCIYLYNAKSPSTQQDVNCEEGTASAPALNDVHLTRTRPQYPVQPERNVSEAAPTLNAPQSTVIHPQYPVQPKGILGPSPESGIASYRYN